MFVQKNCERFEKIKRGWGPTLLKDHMIDCDDVEVGHDDSVGPSTPWHMDRRTHRHMYTNAAMPRLQSPILLDTEEAFIVVYPWHNLNFPFRFEPSCAVR